MRITAQLIDAQSGAHLWADRFDGSLEDVFDLQDKVAAGVAGVIEPTLQIAEIRRSSERPTADLTAYDLYLRALAHTFSHEKDQLAQALELLGRAIDRDHSYSPALGLAALCHQLLHINGWTDDQEATRRQGVDLARRAVRVGTDEPNALCRAAFVLGFFGEDIDFAIGLTDRCLALNPSFADGWYFSGLLRIYVGLPDLAIEHFETSIRLSPRNPTRNHSLGGIGAAHFFGRRFPEAAAKLLACVEEFPLFATSYRLLAACYAHMGRLDDARQIVQRLRSVTPVVMESALRYRNTEHRELFLSGLRLAVGEDT